MARYKQTAARSVLEDLRVLTHYGLHLVIAFLLCSPSAPLCSIRRHAPYSFAFVFNFHSVMSAMSAMQTSRNAGQRSAVAGRSLIAMLVCAPVGLGDVV